MNMSETGYEGQYTPAEQEEHPAEQVREPQVDSPTQLNTVDIVKMGPGYTVNFVATAEPEVSEFEQNGVKVMRSYYRLQDGQPTAYVVPTNEKSTYITSGNTSFQTPLYQASYQTPSYSAGVIHNFAQTPFPAKVGSATASCYRTSGMSYDARSQQRNVGPFRQGASLCRVPTVVQTLPSNSQARMPQFVQSVGQPASYDTYSQEHLAAQYRRYLADAGVQYEDLVTSPHERTTGAAGSVVSAAPPAKTVKPPARKAVWCGC